MFRFKIIIKRLRIIIKVTLKWSGLTGCHLAVLFEHANQLLVHYFPYFVCGYRLSNIPCFETAVRCTSHLL